MRSSATTLEPVRKPWPSVAEPWRLAGALRRAAAEPWASAADSASAARKTRPLALESRQLAVAPWQPVEELASRPAPLPHGAGPIPAADGSVWPTAIPAERSARGPSPRVVQSGWISPSRSLPSRNLSRDKAVRQFRRCKGESFAWAILPCSFPLRSVTKSGIPFQGNSQIIPDDRQDERFAHGHDPRWSGFDGFTHLLTDV